MNLFFSKIFLRFFLTLLRPMIPAFEREGEMVMVRAFKAIIMQGEQFLKIQIEKGVNKLTNSQTPPAQPPANGAPDIKYIIHTALGEILALGEDCLIYIYNRVEKKWSLF